MPAAIPHSSVTATSRKRSAAQTLCGFPRRNYGEAIRFIQLGGKFCRGLVAADTDRTQDFRNLEYFLLYLPGNSWRGTQQALAVCDIQKGLVDREYLDVRRDVLQCVHNGG
jgi:hypothetical protein